VAIATLQAAHLTDPLGLVNRFASKKNVAKSGGNTGFDEVRRQLCLNAQVECTRRPVLSNNILI
jgi:hypothetical protein